jgi:DNA polymerase-3 subunit delta
MSGSDRPKIARALERLRGRFAQEAVEELSANDASGDDAAAACNALGLFGGSHRLVIVHDVDVWKAPDVKAVSAYLADPAPTSVLALVGEQLRKDGPLSKACAKAGEALFFDVTKRDLPRWVADQFSRLGAEADASACRALIDVVGDDVRALASEAEKLAAWAAGEPIDEDAVELLAAPHADTPPFAITDAWGARDLSAVLAACERALERSAEPASRVAARTSHVGRVLECQRLAAAGARPREAAERLKLHRFVAEKAFAHGRNYGPEELGDALVVLAELDLALKGGSRLSSELELERALVAITAPRVPASLQG